MEDYTVLWEKSVKHDLKSVGRKAAEHIRETVETTLVHDPRQGKQLQGTSSLLSGVIESEYIAYSTRLPKPN